MAYEDKRVKVTVEYKYDPDGRLIKKITEHPSKKTGRVTLIAQIASAVAVMVSIFALAIGVKQFNDQQATNQSQVLNQQHQTTLDTYFDRMQELLLAKPDDFKASNPGDEYQSLAEARTFTVLRNLDGPRKGTLVRFLEDACNTLTLQPTQWPQGFNLKAAGAICDDC